MTEWVRCPACGLKHSQRADRTCPRCKRPVGAGPGEATPTAPATPGEAKPTRRTPARLGATAFILYLVGTVTLITNGIRYLGADEVVYSAIEERLGMVESVDRGTREHLAREVSKTSAFYAGLGILFIGFGLFVKDYPVPITLTALILYVGSHALVAVNDPKSLEAGLLMKLLIVLGLVVGLERALSHARRQESAAAEGSGSVTARSSGAHGAR